MPTTAKPKRPARKAPVAKSSRVPRFPPSPKEAVALFDAVMEAVPGIERKILFGYPCGFVNGYMTVGLHADDFFIRLPAEEQAPLLKLKGGGHLEVMPGRPMVEYVVLPAAVRVKKAELKKWVERAAEHARRMPAKSKKAKRPG